MSQHDFAAMRRAMVESQLRTSDVNDRAVITAMMAVPRETFVPPALHAVAYMDRAIPLASGRAMSPPVATGLMIQALGPRPAERALVIGGGTGYTAAVLSRLAGTVTMVEGEPALAADARGHAATWGFTVIEGPLTDVPAGGPFNLILIDGAVEHLPDSFGATLVPGGRLAGGIVDRGITRIIAGTRHGDAFGTRVVADGEVALLPGFGRRAGFTF